MKEAGVWGGGGAKGRGGELLGASFGVGLLGVL